ncbi:unnamed protein product [Musa acuminata var. zebrina]
MCRRINLTVDNRVGEIGGSSNLGSWKSIKWWKRCGKLELILGQSVENILGLQHSKRYIPSCYVVKQSFGAKQWHQNPQDNIQALY